MQQLNERMSKMNIHKVYVYKDSQGRTFEYNYPLTELELVNKHFVYSHSYRQES